MWNVRDGSVVRDLLTGITGVWQVVFEARWCVAASNRNDATVLDVWDFGNEADEDWVGEPAGSIYDEEEEDEDDMGTARIRRMTTTVVEDEDQEDAMDQDVIVPSDVDSADIEIDVEEQPRQRRHRSRGGGDVDVDDADSPGDQSGRLLEGVEASRWAPAGTTSNTGTNRTNPTQGRPLRGGNGGPNAAGPSRRVPAVAFGRTLRTNDETPTRPRTRGVRRR
jgi:F-box and WD-40 domain protein CDC4